jgi:quinol monooxygenase YgiN
MIISRLYSNMKINFMTQESKEIICIAHITAKEGQRDALLNILQSLIKPSKSEPGCLSYRLHHNIENPNMFTFIDKFKDQEAFDYHCETAHVKEAFDILIPPLAENIDISVHHEIIFE